MKLYRFSPIKSKEELLQAVQHVATATTELCKNIISQELPIGYLTIFSHYPTEFENLKQIISEMGELGQGNNGPFVQSREPIQLPNNKLEKLRIRQPDPYRMQVGCNDFVVNDYEDFKNKSLDKYPKNLRLIVRPEYEMIEFFDPDFDVLAYILSR